MVIGSAEEDALPREDPAGGFRSLNHFYDPLTGLGLSNIPIDDRMSPIGVDSPTWAATFDSPGIDVWLAGFGANVGKYNKWSWQNTRDYEWHGLTDSDPAVRRVALTNMFRALGQVMHLLEDSSQPQHTRNEQHLWPGSPIENYGKTNLANLNFQHGMLDWRGLGFSKLKDFWDRQLYDGSPSALEGDANGGAKLGLAEFSNGNFLGARHVFPEYFKPGSVEYYPLPSRDKSTNYKEVKANPAVGLEALPNNPERKGIYIKKAADGITGTHLCRINYLGAKKFSGLAAKAFCTIDDPLVLNDYHSILIPKAIEYSAGILDYFFRGQLEVVGVAWDGSQYNLTVRNQSGQELGSGGAFTVWKDASGNRSAVGSPVTLTQTVADNGTWSFNFPGPEVTESAKYIVVYQGTIGLTDGQASDSVDKDIAIAAKNFLVEPSTAAPCSLWIADNTDFGQVTLDTTFYGVDFCGTIPNLPPGKYKLHYLNGVYSLAHCNFDPQCLTMNPLIPPSYFVAVGIGGDSTLSAVGLTGLNGDYLPIGGGFTTAAEAETDYLARDAAMPEIFLGDSVNAETLAFQLDEDVCNYMTQSETQPFTGGPTFKVTRVQKLIAPQPVSLQIENLSTYANGRFTIQYGSDITAPIAFDASASTVQSALNALASIAAEGGVTCSGSLSAGMTVTWNIHGPRSMLDPRISTVNPGMNCTIVRTQIGIANPSGQSETQIVSVIPICSFFNTDNSLPEWDGSIPQRKLVGVGAPKWYFDAAPNPASPALRQSNLQFLNATVALGCAPSPPPSAPAVANAGAGNVDTGTHQWAVTFSNSDPSYTADSPVGPFVSLSLAAASQVNLSGIPLGPSGTVARHIYRTRTGETAYRLVGDINDNTTTTFTDNVADSGILYIPSPAEHYWALAITGSYGGMFEVAVWNGWKPVGNDPTGTYAVLPNYFDNLSECGDISRGVQQIVLDGTF